MNTLFLEIQPTDTGDEVSWRRFLAKKLSPPSPMEKKFRLIVQLTDAISAILKISASIDPRCRVSIERWSGFLFPEFTLNIRSEKFEIQAEKVFVGGASRENVFNSRVELTIRSISEAMLKLFEKSYRELGPKPFIANYDSTVTSLGKVT
jgi:hypothetical protein